ATESLSPRTSIAAAPAAGKRATGATAPATLTASPITSRWLTGRQVSNAFGSVVSSRAASGKEGSPAAISGLVGTEASDWRSQSTKLDGAGEVSAANAWMVTPIIRPVVALNWSMAGWFAAIRYSSPCASLRWIDAAVQATWKASGSVTRTSVGAMYWPADTL